jgi:hypothetical protein
MVVGAPGVNTISSQSQGGGRLKSRRTVVAGEVPGPGPAVEARLWDEDLATQSARAAVDFSYDLGDNSLSAEPDNEVDLGINVVVVGPARNRNSVSAPIQRELGLRLSIVGSTFADVGPLCRRIYWREPKAGGPGLTQSVCKMCRCRLHRSSAEVP